MKKKSPKNVDVSEVMVQIQAQLAKLDQKLESFINKSLTDIAQALAAQKTVTSPRPVAPPPTPSGLPRPLSNPRPMFAVICFECGKDCQIPFKPAPGRPVYCPECFAKRKAGNVNKPNIPQPAPVPVAIKTPEPVVKNKKKAAPAKKTVVKKSVSKKKPVAKKKSKN